MNLDELNIDELNEFISDVEINPKKVAQELFPDEKGSVRAINYLAKYAKEKAELLKHASFNRQDKVKKLKERCDSIYRTIPDFAKWD